MILTKELAKEKFLYLYNTLVKRQGSEEFLDWLTNETDFFTAPASTRFHEAYSGGLVEHSLTVFFALQELVDMYYKDTPLLIESVVIVSLLHDVCKTNMYVEEMRNKKINGEWQQVPVYTINEQFQFGGHGSKSVYLIQRFMQLTEEEATSINCHMGVENGKWEVANAFRKCQLAFLLHTADMASTIPQVKKRLFELRGYSTEE